MEHRRCFEESSHTSLDIKWMDNSGSQSPKSSKKLFLFILSLLLVFYTSYLSNYLLKIIFFTQAHKSYSFVFSGILGILGLFIALWKSDGTGTACLRVDCVHLIFFFLFNFMLFFFLPSFVSFVVKHFGQSATVLNVLYK